MTRDEALERAGKMLPRCGAATTTVQAYVAYAAELRAGATLPPEDPAARLTLHDIEARFCSDPQHYTPQDTLNARFIVRDRRTTSWWMHTDDHTMCETGGK